MTVCVADERAGNGLEWVGLLMGLWRPFIGLAPAAPLVGAAVVSGGLGRVGGVAGTWAGVEEAVHG